MLSVMSARRYNILAAVLLGTITQAFMYEQMLSCSIPIMGILNTIWPFIVQIQIFWMTYHTGDRLYAITFHLLGDFVMSVVSVRYTNINAMPVCTRTLWSLYYGLFPLLCQYLKNKIFRWLSDKHPGSWLYRIL
jgi:hypothetical protein